LAITSIETDMQGCGVKHFVLRILSMTMRPYFKIIRDNVRGNATCSCEHYAR